MKTHSPMGWNRGRVLVSFLALIGTGAILVALTSWLWSWPFPVRAAERGSVTVNVSDSPLPREARLSTSFAPVVQRVAGSVV